MDRKIKNKYERFYFVSMILSQEGRKEYVGIVCIWAQVVRNCLGTLLVLLNYCQVLSIAMHLALRPNSPGPLTDDWKVTDNIEINMK